MSNARDLSDIRFPISVAQGGTGRTTDFNKGFIGGFQITTPSDNAITITAGAAYVPSLGRIVEMPANKVWSSLTVLAARTQHHFYLYDNAGVADIEVSLTTPVKYYGTAYTKSGDTSRRYLGSLLSGTTGFYPVEHDAARNRINYITGAPGSAPFLITSYASTTPALVDVVISDSGVSSIAPRATTVVLHAIVSLVGGSYHTSPADQATAVAASNWGHAAGPGIVPLDVRPARTTRNSAVIGSYWLWTGGAVTSAAMYGVGYTFER